MAVCSYCADDMSDDATTSCVEELVWFSGDPVTSMPVIPFTGEGRCHDCHVAHGGFHHPGCDNERCPRCSGQLITCGCPT